MKLGTLIFSKNRACQLDLLLRSLTVPVSILYTFDPEFAAGYQKIIKMYPQINFIKQTNFKSQLIKFVKDFPLLLFLTDDDVMIAPFSPNCPEIKEFVKDRQVASLSLGLSATVAGKKWHWADYRHNYRLRMWGYPMSVDSCLFRQEDILPTIGASKITNLNFLEAALNLHLPPRPLMMCFDQPLIVNNSVNQVQNDFPAHTLGISTQKLEQLFLQGQKISLSDIQQKSKNVKIYRIKEPYQFETD